MKIKKDDQILVISGKDLGKTGKVEKILTKEGKIVVTGINVLKKHKKSKSKATRGGIIEFSNPLDISNVKIICPHCNKASRVGYKIVKDKKYRICKKCQSNLDKIE